MTTATVNNVAYTLVAAVIADVTAFANETLSTVKFTFAGRRYELTRFRAGRVEVYEEGTDDGIFHFLGYHDEIGNALPGQHGRAIGEGMNVLRAAHEDYWTAFLPGADTWSQPRV